MNKRPFLAAALPLAIFVAGWLALGSTVQAAEHTIDAYGLRMALDTQWPGTGGYRPVRFEFTPTKPITSDRQLELVFHVYQWNQDQDGVVVKQVIDLPAGSTGMKVSLPVPFMSLRSYHLRVFEDGVELTKLAINSGATNNANDNLPRIQMLVSTRCDPQFADGPIQIPTGNSGQGNPGQASGPGIVDEMGTSGNNQIATIQRVVQRLPLADFPSRWIEYTSLDVVVISRADLKELASQRPPQYQALLEWVRAGGNLWVTQVGAQWEDLPAVEKALLLSVPADATDATDPLQRGWKPPSSFSYSPSPQNYGGPYGVPMPMEAIAIAQAPGMPRDPAAEGSNGKASRVDLFSRPIDFGQVTVIAQGSPFPSSRIETLGVPAERLLWEQRNGVLPGGQTHGFWDFLIPGVGLAPVGAFQILITLFVVVIGPLNYFLLMRYRRLQMLIVTTPLCALAITGGLFLYALVTDGLGVRVRARTYTTLDQKAGHAASWSRLSYYAGLAPRGGMTFGVDTAVYPLRDVNYFDEDDSRQPPMIEWVDRVTKASGLNPVQGPPLATHQHLAQGWISPRTPTQFLTQRSRPSKLRLEIVPSPDESSLSVTNHLGVPVEWLVIHLADEKYYLIRDLAIDASVEAPAVDFAAAGIEYRTLYHAEDPTAPIEVDTNYYGRMNWRRARRMWNGGGGPMTIPTFVTGRLERMLAETATRAPEPRTYLAILETSPELELGVDGAREEASFHVLSGKW